MIKRSVRKKYIIFNIAYGDLRFKTDYKLGNEDGIDIKVFSRLAREYASSLCDYKEDIASLEVMTGAYNYVKAQIEYYINKNEIII